MPHLVGDVLTDADVFFPGAGGQDFHHQIRRAVVAQMVRIGRLSVRGQRFIRQDVGAGIQQYVRVGFLAPVRMQKGVFHHDRARNRRPANGRG